MPLALRQSRISYTIRVLFIPAILHGFRVEIKYYPFLLNLINYRKNNLLVTFLAWYMTIFLWRSCALVKKSKLVVMPLKELAETTLNLVLWLLQLIGLFVLDF